MRFLTRFAATTLIAAAVSGCAATNGDSNEQSTEATRPVVNLSGATDGPVRAALEVASTSVELGQPIQVEVTITHAGDEARRIKEVVHDTQSVSFAMVWNRTTMFEYERIVMWGAMPREWETRYLEPGDSITETFEIPTLVTGPVQIGVHYRGAGDDLVRSDPVTIDVKPPANGGDLVTRFATNYGDYVVALWPDVAPNTALHFVELVRTGFYDDVSFHRLIPGFVLQGGDPAGNGTGDAGYNLRAEFNERKHVTGVLSMARNPDPDSAGSQFFICLGAAPHLDNSYTGFGEVVEGFETTIRKIEREAERYEDPPDRLWDDVVIEKATLEIRAPGADAEKPAETDTESD